MAALIVHQQSWVVAPGSVWLTKLKIFIIWLFTFVNLCSRLKTTKLVSISFKNPTASIPYLPFSAIAHLVNFFMLYFDTTLSSLDPLSYLEFLFWHPCHVAVWAFEDPPYLVPNSCFFNRNSSFLGRVTSDTRSKLPRIPCVGCMTHLTFLISCLDLIAIFGPSSSIDYEIIFTQKLCHRLCIW